MVLLDGVRADTAFSYMGYLNSLCLNTDKGIRTTSICDNPSVSRTNYETLHTGVPSVVHGITSNLVNIKSQMPRNMFKELKQNGKTSGVVASTWFYDLYGKDNYSHQKHKELDNLDVEDITYGRFYADNVPDHNVASVAYSLQTADYLVHKYLPDYLLLHLVTPDHLAHENGIGREYNNEVNKIDVGLGALIPQWTKLVYEIIITSDHGMIDNNHGGSQCEVIKVPLYIISSKGWKPDNRQYHHTEICPLIINRILPGSDYTVYLDSIMKDVSYVKNRC